MTRKNLPPAYKVSIPDTSQLMGKLDALARGYGITDEFLLLLLASAFCSRPPAAIQVISPLPLPKEFFRRGKSKK